MLHINTVGNYRSKHINFVQAMEEGDFIDMTATISSREKVLIQDIGKKLFKYKLSHHNFQRSLLYKESIYTSTSERSTWTKKQHSNNAPILSQHCM